MLCKFSAKGKKCEFCYLVPLIKKWQSYKRDTCCYPCAHTQQPKNHAKTKKPYNTPEKPIGNDHNLLSKWLKHHPAYSI